MKILIILLLTALTSSIFDIEKYGAVPFSDNVKDQLFNQKAIEAAIKAANLSPAERIVKIPSKTFYSMPIKIQNVSNLKIQILGRLSASKSVKYWPRDPSSKRHLNFIQINNCTDIQISGGGKIDGRGHHWWILVYLNDKKYMNNQDDRPHLINMINCQKTKIHDLVMKNSANFHLKMDHCHDAEIYNLNIKVNTTAQFNLMKQNILTDLIPMFPFNTDGIDPSGGNMHIYNLTVQNFDDVVVPKPSHDDDCTKDMLIENIEVRLGVGMSIGSVPPHEGGSCIRNITFRNVAMKRPFKGIYIKTNPGDKGWGNITSIEYKNFTMDRPIWWAIYLGPQQMRQPGGAGPGCMIYPFDPKGTCSTQPRVSIKNITMQDITIHKSLLYPVIMRCNASNPCTAINLINVKVDEWQIGEKQKGYTCEFVSGRGVANEPKIYCLDDEIQSKSTQQQKINHSSFIQQLFNQQNHESTFNKRKKKYLWMRILNQLEKAVQQIQYEDSQEDEFIYNLEQIEMQFQNEVDEQILHKNFE